MKRALLVAFHYPPEGTSSGVLRTLKFSKYLSRHGWEPQVLTLRESAYAVRDPGLLKQIPQNVKVHRARGFDTAQRFAIRGRYWSWVAFPDRYISWLPFAALMGLGVVRRERIQALYSTSPVPTAHLVAALIQAWTGLPWIADFRDPWVEEGIYPRPGSLRYHLERALEGAVLRRATRITVTTPDLGAELRSRYPALPKEKIRVIYNGYDEEDFRTLPPRRRSDRMEIVHAGLLTQEFRDPFPVLRELANLIAEGEIPRGEVSVTFMGGGHWPHSDDFAKRVESIGLADVVQVEGRTSHEEAIARQAGAAALLLLQASEDTRGLIPAKAFEYLRLGRPILALTLPGATAELLSSMAECHVHEPSDSDGLRRALLDLYARWRSGADDDVAGRGSALLAYERSHLTGELAALFDEVVRVPEASGVGVVRHV